LLSSLASRVVEVVQALNALRLALALPSAGKSSPAKMAMMAITTSSSIV
jgi:hypothetical protein